MQVSITGTAVARCVTPEQKAAELAAQQEHAPPQSVAEAEAGLIARRVPEQAPEDAQ